MKLLRDKSFSTQILILYETYIELHSKLTPIAEKIGITQQAVSEYMKLLIKEKLVQKKDGKYKPTVKGIYLLQQELSNLKQFVEERIVKLSLIKNDVALAKTQIKSGQKLALFMEDGWLVAYGNRKSSSTGMANNNAKIGEYVYLGNLSGIIDHIIGKIYYYELPNPFTLKQNHMDIKLLKNQILKKNIDRIGILDIVAKSLCRNLGIKPDFEFGVTYAAIDAAQRGLNTAIFGYEDKIRESLKNFQNFNEIYTEKINYELISIK